MLLYQRNLFALLCIVAVSAPASIGSVREGRWRILGRSRRYREITFSAWLNGLPSRSHNADTVFSFLWDTFGNFLCSKITLTEQRNCPPLRPCSHISQAGAEEEENKKQEKKAFSTAREVRGGPMLWHAHSWGCHDRDPQQLFAQTLPPGVLTGAIHHSGMGPPTIQGWAINRPELSRFSPVWLLCLIGSLTTWFPCNLPRKYMIIT